MTDNERISRSDTRSVAIAGAVVALAGFLVQAVSTRPLTEAELSQFLGYWAMLFAVVGVVGGLQHEATRATAQAELTGSNNGARIAPLTVGVGLTAAVVILATSPLWASGILPSQPLIGAGLIAFAVLAFSGHAALVGVLAGRRQWGTYSRVMGAESLVRVALVGVAILAGTGLVGYEVATAAATMTWVAAVLVSPTTRAAWSQRADVDVKQFLRRSSHALIASISTAVLVVGFPAIVGLTSSTEEYLSIGTLVLALSLTRAPLLLPINTFQGVAIQYFVSAGQGRMVALARIIGVVVVVGIVGSLLAFLAGPWVMGLVTGRVIGGAVLAALTAASTVLAILVLTGTVALAIGRHRAYSTGWAAAALIATAILLTPIPVEERILLGLAIGPLVGSLVHLQAIRSGVQNDRPVLIVRSDSSA